MANKYSSNESLNGIRVKTHNGEILYLEVTSSYTIYDVKAKIRNRIGIPHDEQALIFNATILEDSITLADYYIKKDSTLKLMLKSSGLVPIFINRHGGMRCCTLKVKLSDSIGNVKAKIPNIDPEYMALVFNDMVLDDSCTLADFNIKKDFTLILLSKSREQMEIFVKTLTGDAISLKVKPSDTISNVKTQIQSWQHIHINEQVLVFDEMVLDDRGTLVDLHIKKGSTLTLMCKSRRLMQIFVKTCGGKTYSVEVKPLDTIANLKAKLHAYENRLPPPEDIVLLFDGMRLQDSRTLAEYDIHNESMLDYYLIQRGG